MQSSTRGRDEFGGLSDRQGTENGVRAAISSRDRRSYALAYTSPPLGCQLEPSAYFTRLSLRFS